MRRTFTTILCTLALGSTLGALACDPAPQGRPTTQMTAPRSLSGVEVDGALELDAEGKPVLDARARTFFDHFLVAEGEVDDDSLHTLVRAQIDERLGGDAADLAWETFLDYLDYRREASELLERSDELTDDEFSAALAEIRAQTVGDLLGLAEEETQMRTARVMHRVLAAPDLSPNERRRRVAPLRAELELLAPPDAPSQILSRVHAALADVPPDDIAARRAVLEPLIGPEGTERWLALEQRRQTQSSLAERG